MITLIGPAGSLGIIRDKRPHELPLAAWTDGNNVHFDDDAAVSVDGYVTAYDPPTVAPYWLLHTQVPSGPYWLYAGLGKVYATDGVTHADLTRASGGDYGATEDLNWTGGVLGGVGILNNGIDDPQMWLLPSLATRLQRLSAWPTSTKCAAMRPYKAFLVALDVTESGTRYPQMVRWSHPADPNSVPSSWDYADPTKDAGRVELKETSDSCVDCFTLRDANVIYKNTSTWGMQFIGGEFVFRFYKIFDNIGIMSRRCAAEFFSGQHFVLSLDDIVVHDGQQATSLVDKRFRRAFFGSLDPAKYVRNFVAMDWVNNEVWACVVPQGGTYPSKALVWQYKENRLSVRDLPQVSHIENGTVNFSTSTPTTWNADTGTWDSDTSLWDEAVLNPTKRSQLWALPAATKLYGAPFSKQANGVSIPSFLERRGLGLPVAGKEPDFSHIKTLRRLWLHCSGPAGKELNVYLSAHNRIDEQPIWQGPYLYRIGQTEAIDCLVTGRLHNIKIVSATAAEWKLTGYEVDVKRRGVA